MTSSAPVLLICPTMRKPGLLLLFFLTSTLLLWVSVVALSGDDKSTTTNLTTTTLHLFTPKPAEARNGNSISSPTSALKPAETFHRGSVVATFDEETGATAAFADGWVEVDEEENVAQEFLGSGGKHKILEEKHYHLHPPHSRPHYHHPKFTPLEDHQQQSYECVLMPKLRPTYSEAANTAEVVDDLINAGHHQVHHLYGVDVEGEDGDENGVHSHRHQKATKRKAKSAATSVSKATASTSKLRDFGNFLYVDDTVRPSYSSLESMEFVTSSPPSPPSSKQKTKKGHRKSSNKKHGSSSKELNQLFSSLKNSLDQLLCYQNEECYGGEMGGEMSGRDGEEKLEAFIRHVRASKRVFEMLERNRHRLMEVAASNKDSGEEEMMVSPHPEPGRPAGPLHLPNRFMTLDPRDLIDGGPVVPMYDDTVQRSMAVKAPPPYRKLMHGHSVGKYLQASSIIPPLSVPSASNHQHQRRLPARSLVSPSGFDSFSPSSSSSSLLPSKFGRHLIGSLLSSGANLLMNRAAVDGSVGGGGWQPKRQWASSSVASPSASSVYRPSITSGWPNPVLVIKEYEEYNE